MSKSENRRRPRSSRSASCKRTSNEPKCCLAILCLAPPLTPLRLEHRADVTTLRPGQVWHLADRLNGKWTDVCQTDWMRRGCRIDKRGTSIDNTTWPIWSTIQAETGPPDQGVEGRRWCTMAITDGGRWSRWRERSLIPMELQLNPRRRWNWKTTTGSTGDDRPRTNSIKPRFQSCPLLDVYCFLLLFFVHCRLFVAQ